MRQVLGFQCYVKRSSKIELTDLLLREVATVALPARTLRGFQRTQLAPGQSRRVEFRLTPDDLCILDAQMRWTVELGTFRVRIGGNSDASLEGTFQLVTAEGSENNQT